MYKVKFYGIICNARIDDNSFELVGKNKVTQKLLDWYGMIIFHFINFANFVFMADSKFILEVLDEEQEDTQ